MSFLLLVAPVLYARIQGAVFETLKSYNTSVLIRTITQGGLRWFKECSGQISWFLMIFDDFHRKLEKHRITSGNKWSLSNFQWKSMKTNENQWKPVKIMLFSTMITRWRWSSASSLNEIKCSLIDRNLVILSEFSNLGSSCDGITRLPVLVIQFRYWEVSSSPSKFEWGWP